MEETNVTMTAEEMQGEPAAKENETKAEKFIRIGTACRQHRNPAAGADRYSAGTRN